VSFTFRSCCQFSTLAPFSDWLGRSLSDYFYTSSGEQKNADWVGFAVTEEQLLRLSRQM
jgi:hypothetical protein